MKTGLATRLGICLVVLVAGVALQSWFLVALGVIGAFGITVLRAWARATAGAAVPWSVAAILGLIGCGCVALVVYAIGFTDAPLISRLASLFIVLPAAYFLLMAYAVGYGAATGRRIRQADRIESFFARLNSSIKGPRKSN